MFRSFITSVVRRRFEANMGAVSAGTVFLTCFVFVAAGCGSAESVSQETATKRSPMSGERILAVEDAPDDAPLRAARSHPFYRLSNPRTGGSLFGPALHVNYERTRSGEETGPVSHIGIVIRSVGDEGSRDVVNVRANDEAGDIDLRLVFPHLPGSDMPKNAEFYLVYANNWFGGPRCYYKVSNSVVLGEVPQITLAREWTDEEAETFRRKSPDAKKPLGEETRFVGNASGGESDREVSRSSKPMLGVGYLLGEWEGDQCVGQLEPIFVRDRETRMAEWIIAKEGYAVGGMNVQSQQYVDAVQLVFMKIGPDGELVPNDRYLSDWIGYPVDGESTQIGCDGRKVIGLHCRQGAIVDAVALVMKSRWQGRSQ